MPGTGVSLCITDMRGQSAVLRREDTPPPLRDDNDLPGLEVRKHYAMLTDMVLVNLNALHPFPYIRLIDDDRVEMLVANILVRTTLPHAQTVVPYIRKRLSSTIARSRCCTRVSDLPST